MPRWLNYVDLYSISTNLFTLTSLEHYLLNQAKLNIILHPMCHKKGGVRAYILSIFLLHQFELCKCKDAPVSAEPSSGDDCRIQWSPSSGSKPPIIMSLSRMNRVIIHRGETSKQKTNQNQIRKSFLLLKNMHTAIIQNNEAHTPIHGRIVSETPIP